MAKGWPTALLFLLYSAAIFVGCLLLNETIPRFVLVGRVKQLDALNEKLSGDIRTPAAAAVGGPEGPTVKRDDGDRDLYEEYSGYINPRLKVFRCEIIHIAMVAAGYKTVRDTVTVIKSLLFYRHNPLHFHFISDAAGRHILGTLFSTWQLPAVNVSLYASETATTNVSWIPNSHYSGVFGLLKLTLTSALPATLNKIIVLDTDIMFAGDVARLWQLFATIRKRGKMFGLVENQSNWYLGNLWENHRPWPALGRGFNTGVMMLDLQAMKKHGWEEMWFQVTTEMLQSYKETALADQDIINAVIKEHPDIHYTLPCAWNVQLSEHSLSEYCYRDAEEFNIINWNSPKKLLVTNNHGPYFKNLYMTFQWYDGDLLKHELLKCDLFGTQKEERIKQESDPCLAFRREVNLVRRTHPFFTEYDYTPRGTYDVTLTSQLSMDRLHMIELLSTHWDGPMSIALHASDQDAHLLLQFINSSPTLKSRKDIGIHIVYKTGNFYSINYLRNVALENTHTSYVFLSDIDFLPMVGLYRYLCESASVLSSGNRALVIPAFETQVYKFDFPSNKQELLKMLSDGRVYTFRHHIWPRGHAPTNYDHWKTAKVPYLIKWAPDFEPYILVSRNVTKYDERFVGFGWNKVSHSMELNAQGYDFVVLPDAFVVHMPHGPSLDIANFRTRKQYRDCVQVLKREFQGELADKYGRKFQEN